MQAQLERVTRQDVPLPRFDEIADALHLCSVLLVFCHVRPDRVSQMTLCRNAIDAVLHDTYLNSASWL